MDLKNLKSDPIVVVGGSCGELATVQALLVKSAWTAIVLIYQTLDFFLSHCFMNY